MAMRFGGSIPTTNHSGIPFAMPTAICTKGTQAPAQVAIAIDWLVVWTQLLQPGTAGVHVNLSGTTPNAATLDKIRSIKIDNTFSVSSIYVVFPDTDDVITCPPQTVVTMPVNTNAQKAIVYAQGLQQGYLPYTRIYFFNVAQPPSVDPAIQQVFPQYKGSPTIQRNATEILTPGYGSPALGDQTVTYNFGNVIIPQILVPALFLTPSTGFIYLTHVDYAVYGEFSALGIGSGELYVESTGASGTLNYFGLGSNRVANGTGGGFPDYTRNTLLRLSGMNLKLDATETWQIRVANFLGGYSCGISMTLAWSHNPD